MKIQRLKLKKLPFKPRSEKETEEMLHRYRVIARKKQIEMNKIDYENCGEYQSLNILQWQTPQSRKQVYKKIVEIIRQCLP